MFRINRQGKILNLTPGTRPYTFSVWTLSTHKTAKGTTYHAHTLIANVQRSEALRAYNRA